MINDKLTVNQWLALKMFWENGFESDHSMLTNSYNLNWGTIAPVKPHWQKIAKQCLQAYRTYKNWCKALGRYSKLKNSRGKSIAMRAINHWRNEFYRLSILERQLRAN